MTAKPVEIIPKPPLTPFRRNRNSRVFFASEDNFLEEQDEDKELDNPHTISSLGTLKISVPSADFNENHFSSVSSKSENRIPSPANADGFSENHFGSPETVEEKSSGNEDPAATNSCGEESSSSPISSPPGSWRGSDRSSSNGSWRCSPSQRSQDSGYSDSGESAAGSPTEDTPAAEPQVKHITRVYFGEYRRLTGVNESTQTPPHYVTPRTHRVAKRRISSFRTHGLSRSEPRLPSVASQPNSTNQGSPTTTATNKDEHECQLEHKSLSSVCLPSAKISEPQIGDQTFTNSPTIQNSTFTLDLNQSVASACSTASTSSSSTSSSKSSSEKKLEKYSSKIYRKLSYAKRLATRRSSCKSSEALNDLCDKPKRRNPIKAKRRWSSADIDRCPPILSIDVIDRLSSTTIHEDQEYVSPLDRTQKSPLEIAEYLGNDSLFHWLGDLILMTDSECMNTLQSKSLYTDPQEPVAATTQARLSDIQKRSHLVSAEFALLCQRLETLQLDQVPTLVDSLVASVKVFIQSSTESKSEKRSLQCQIKVVEQICHSLLDICSSSLLSFKTNIEEENKPKGRRKFSKTDKEKIREFVQIVTALGHAFTKLVDILLCDGIRTLVDILEEEVSEREVESAIAEVTSLGVNGGHICKLVSRVGGIRALLGVCLESRFRRLRALSLRALATVCCVAEGIDKFEKEGGVSVIAEVLCDSDGLEDERAEAAGVLAQITSPWVEDSHSLPALHQHLKPLVASLTELAESTTSAEVFLLTSAALANLTFLDPTCIEALLESSTHSMLLKMAQTEENLSVFTKDQIATILANMSSSSKASEQLLKEQGIEVLLKLLQTTPKDTHRVPELAAIERVQQKSAIALSRLSNKETAASVILSNGGASRLANLCRNEKERNHSDAVLVACLAALRKIATSCGHEEAKTMNASELIEPKLLDSFLIYSSQGESFV